VSYSNILKMQRFWGKEIRPGKPLTETLEEPLHLTQVALDAHAKGSDRNSLQVTVEGKKHTLASCRLGALEQFPLDLVFDADMEITLEVVGSNPLHVSGYYILYDEDLEDDQDLDEEGEDLGEEDDELIELSDEEDEGDLLVEEMEDESSSKVHKKVVISTKPNPNEEEKRNSSVEKRQQTPQKQSVGEKRKNESTSSSPNEKTSSKKSKKENAGKEEQKPKQPAAKISNPETPNGKQKQRPESPTTPSESKGVPIPIQKNLPMGLVCEDLVLGNGAPIKEGHKARVKYIGKLASGKTFDSSLNKPFEFRFGLGQVIKGWDLGLKGMRIGGKRKLTIPPKLGYGSEKAGAIPPNSTLIFEVELVGLN